MVACHVERLFSELKIGDKVYTKTLWNDGSVTTTSGIISDIHKGFAYSGGGIFLASNRNLDSVVIGYETIWVEVNIPDPKEDIYILYDVDIYQSDGKYYRAFNSTLKFPPEHFIGPWKKLEFKEVN